MRRKVKRPTRLALPLIVKSLSEDGSFGISQASIVDTDEQLAERVAFVHERIETAAIAEQYIEGRELYVGVLGNNRLQVLPVWELKFGSMGGRARKIATQKAKHDPEYQERVGIVDGPADDLAPEVTARIQRTAKRIYKTLGSRRLRAHRFSSRHRRHAVFHRSQSQSRNRQEPGIRDGGQARSGLNIRTCCSAFCARHKPRKGRRVGGVKGDSDLPRPAVCRSDQAIWFIRRRNASSSPVCRKSHGFQLADRAVQLPHDIARQRA